MTPRPQAQQSSFGAPPQAPAAADDPFAALGGAFSSQPPAPAAPPQPTASNEDDEWNFSSSLPPEPSKPKEHAATISNTSIKIDFRAKRGDPSNNCLNMIFAFTNNTAGPISELHFKVAVTKVRFSSYIILPPPPSLFNFLLRALGY